MDNSIYTFHAKTRERLFSIIFGTHTVPGRNFDVALLVVILISVAIALVDSVPAYHQSYGGIFFALEWFLTLLFCIEYGTRIYCAPRIRNYVFSFFGIIDFVSILPLFVALVYQDANYLIIIRLMRVLRVFRVLKLFSYITEATLLGRSLIQSRRKILVFFSHVVIIATVLGAAMYIVEGEQRGFNSIPEGIYWAIVTITTVGYGDIVPQTVMGKTIASITMLLGYAIIAIPTGIVTAELSHEIQRHRSTEACPSCLKTGHESDAKHCKHCGAMMTPP